MRTGCLLLCVVGPFRKWAGPRGTAPRGRTCRSRRAGKASAFVLFQCFLSDDHRLVQTEYIFEKVFCTQLRRVLSHRFSPSKYCRCFLVAAVGEERQTADSPASSPAAAASRPVVCKNLSSVGARSKSNTRRRLEATRI